MDLDGWKAEGDSWQSQDWRLVCDGKEPSTVWSTTKHGDFELIADVKLPRDGEDNQAGILIGGPDASELPRVGVRANTDGKWQRYRVRVEDGKIAVGVGDGELREVPGSVQLPKESAIGLAVEGGEVEWANVLVREL